MLATVKIANKMTQKEELSELRKLQKDTNRYFSKIEWERLKWLEKLKKGNRL